MFPSLLCPKRECFGLSSGECKTVERSRLIHEYVCTLSHTEKDRASRRGQTFMDISRMQVYIKNAGQFSQPPQNLHCHRDAQPSYSAHPLTQPLLPLDKLEQVSQLHLKAEPVQKEAELGRGSGSRLVSDSHKVPIHGRTF